VIQISNGCGQAVKWNWQLYEQPNYEKPMMANPGWRTPNWQFLQIAHHSHHIALPTAKLMWIQLSNGTS